MKFHMAAIIVLTVGILLIGATTFINDFGSSYGDNVDFEGLNATQDRINVISADSKEIQDDISAMQLSEGGVDFTMPYVMIKTGWRSLLLMLKSWTLLPTMASEMATSSPIAIPEYVLAAVVAMILITSIAMLIYLFFKWKVEN